MLTRTPAFLASAVMLSIVGDEGLGLKATARIDIDVLLFEYASMLVTHAEALTRERQYKNSIRGVGCYMFFFEFMGIQLCLDSTSPSHQMRPNQHCSAATKVLELHGPQPIDAEGYGCARYANHSSSGANLRPCIIDQLCGGTTASQDARDAIGSHYPRLCFFSSREISIGEELRFNYNEVRKEVLTQHTWLQH